MAWETRIRHLSPSLLYYGLGAEALVLLAAQLESGGTLPAFFQSAARLSGRVSLFFFALLLVYATLRPELNRADASFRVKMRLFRDFAVLHLIHWCLLALSVWYSGFELHPVRLAGGILAYVLIVSVPLILQTSYLQVKQRERLQSVYLFWVWFVFMMTYITRLRGQSPDAGGSPEAWWPLAILTAGLMLWRWWMQATRRVKPA